MWCATLCDRQGSLGVRTPSIAGRPAGWLAVTAVGRPPVGTVWCGAHSYASSTHLLITSQVDSSLLEYEHEALALDVGSLESSAGRGALIVQVRLLQHSTSTAEY